MSNYSQQSIDAAEQLLHPFVTHAAASVLKNIGIFVQNNIDKFEDVTKKYTSKEDKINAVIEQLIGTTFEQIDKIDTHPKPCDLCWGVVLNGLKNFKKDQKQTVKKLVKEYDNLLRSKNHSLYIHLSKQEKKEVFSIFEEFLLENIT